MMWRLINLPIFSSVSSAVEARDFNLIRRALLKSDSPIRIPFAEMPDIEMIIDEDSWVCVDSSNNDMPIVAWLDFSSKRRTNLHEAITCQKNYYHFAAGRVASVALRYARAYLTENHTPAPVCELPIHNKPKKTWKTATAAELSCV